uniref:Uncharacterized protein n=1 Tax=Cacopsylla melanoneura TaxID=428564 RepID=A0A8D8PLU5_9HEMI
MSGETNWMIPTRRRTKTSGVRRSDRPRSLCRRGLMLTMFTGRNTGHPPSATTSRSPKWLKRGPASSSDPSPRAATFNIVPTTSTEKTYGWDPGTSSPTKKRLSLPLSRGTMKSVSTNNTWDESLTWPTL